MRGRSGLQYTPPADPQAFAAKLKSHQDQQTAAQEGPRHKKNTETFTPSHEPAQMRILYCGEGAAYPRAILTRDVMLVPHLFCSPGDLSLYRSLHTELSTSGLTEHQIWASWHGDSHLIANDR